MEIFKSKVRLKRFIQQLGGGSQQIFQVFAPTHARSQVAISEHTLSFRGTNECAQN